MTFSWVLYTPGFIIYKIIIKKNKERIRPSKSEVLRLRCDNKKIRKITNWKPSFNKDKGFEKGLENTIKWFKNKDNLNFYKKELRKYPHPRSIQNIDALEIYRGGICGVEKAEAFDVISTGQCGKIVMEW